MIVAQAVVAIERARAAELLTDAVGVGLAVTAGVVLFRAEAARRAGARTAAWRAATTVAGALALVVVAGLLVYLPDPQSASETTAAGSSASQTTTSTTTSTTTTTGPTTTATVATPTSPTSSAPPTTAGPVGPSTSGPSTTAVEEPSAPAPPPEDDGVGGDPPPAGEDGGEAPPPDAEDPGDPAPPTAEGRSGTHVVVAGDNLWSIAAATMRDELDRPPTDGEIASYWNLVIDANADTLVEPGNADLIVPGQVIQLPVTAQGP